MIRELLDMLLYAAIIFGVLAVVFLSIFNAII